MGDERQPRATRAGERPSAYDDAVRRLGRRPFAAGELRAWLLERGHEPAAVQQALERCTDQRWLDDASLAHEYIVARAARIGHGPNRLIGDLTHRGVDESTARAAWGEALRDGRIDLDAMLVRRVQRRLAGRGRLAPRALSRVYTSLLREGFERDAVKRALRPHAASADPAFDEHDGQDDDFA